MPWNRLKQAWQRHRERAAIARRPIPDDLWKRTLVRYPFLGRQDPALARQLRDMTSLFLDRKEFTTAGGLKLTDAIAVAIAAQACLPVLKLGLHRYDGFVGVVVVPDAVRAQREFTDEDGVVHAVEQVLAGEATPGGPVMLSWRDVRQGGLGSQPGYNVVIHEFAHVLDMANGAANGAPELPADLPPSRWREVMSQALARLHHQLDAGEPTLLDPYAANGPEEFFAVASEAFFVSPSVLAEGDPAVYGLLRHFYRQDPVQDTALPRSRAAAGGFSSGP